MRFIAFDIGLRLLIERMAQLFAQPSYVEPAELFWQAPHKASKRHIGKHAPGEKAYLDVKGSLPKYMPLRGKAHNSRWR